MSEAKKASDTVEDFSSGDVLEFAQFERKLEEKSSVKKRRKLNEYNGLGRRHTDAQIDEILDWYVLTGELPNYVSERQRSAYKRHPRLELRREHLEKAGFIKAGRKRRKVSSTAKGGTNVLDMERAKAQRQRRAT